PIAKRGVYMGITNCSCYGRDLPQDSGLVTWFLPEENGTATGFGNLVRDVLIAKHFQIPEVTFFLLKSASDDGVYIMGGTFEAYGVDFLDRIDEHVNIHPPEQFNIFYVGPESKRVDNELLDWLLNINRPLGLLLVSAMLGGALLLNVKAKAIKKKILRE
nr:hypothetical protein [Candidatus Sigynarchaeota archaeon]